jgi:putative transposase
MIRAKNRSWPESHERWQQGCPITSRKRGNRRQETFFCDNDYRAYIQFMGEWCTNCGVEVWACCLMPNHVHLIVVPELEESLRRAVGEAHLRQTRMVNFRQRWRGHFWQGRFGSYAMDERYLVAAVRYVELNPVRNGQGRLPGLAAL